MIYKSFEDYLQAQHAKDYHGLDDEMPDAFDGWLTNLDGEMYIKYADDYSLIKYEDGYKAGLEDK